MTTPPLAIDNMVSLTINNSQQRVRLRAARSGLPPLLVVQQGPGLPILHEVAKFHRLLHLERDYLVAYWEQRGCGNASAASAQCVSLAQQVDDLQAVVKWLGDETRQRVLVFGISMGATISLLAAPRAVEHVKAVIAISPDLQTRGADAAVDAFLHKQVGLSRRRRLHRALVLRDRMMSRVSDDHMDGKVRRPRRGGRAQGRGASGCGAGKLRRGHQRLAQRIGVSRVVQ